MPADTVTVDATRLAALEAIAAAVQGWADGHTGADPIGDAWRRHRAVLDPDPGQHLAWPEADDEPEPVPGVNYLPADGDWTYNRVDEEEPDGRDHGRNQIGYGHPHGRQRWVSGAAA